jgi:ABC-type sugar transport system ATPase subunit
VTLPDTNQQTSHQGPVTLGIRPEDLVSCSPDEAWFSGELSVAERLGSQTYGYIEIGGGRMLTVEFPRNNAITVGERVHVRGNAAAMHLFDSETERRISQ